jgi:hypothetical protein
MFHKTALQRIYHHHNRSLDTFIELCDKINSLQIQIHTFRPGWIPVRILRFKNTADVGWPIAAGHGAVYTARGAVKNQIPHRGSLKTYSLFWSAPSFLDWFHPTRPTVCAPQRRLTAPHIKIANVEMTHTSHWCGRVREKSLGCCY